MARQYVRYGNRKLYCKGEGRYVTLSEIVRNVRRGVSFSVTCHKSKVDMTDITLRQALVSQFINVPRERLVSLIKEFK